MSRRSKGSPARSSYEFIRAHSDQFGVRMMCRILDVGSERLLQVAPASPIESRTRGCPVASPGSGVVHGEPPYLRCAAGVPRPARGGRDLQQAPCRAAHAREQPPRAAWLSEPAMVRR